MNDLAPISSGRKLPTIDIDGMSRALRAADDAKQVIVIERQLDLLEQHMRDSGLYPPAQVREVNELRMRARWRLGQLLAAITRGTGPGRGKKNHQAGESFMVRLRALDLAFTDAMRAQRIGTLPEPE